MLAPRRFLLALLLAGAACSAEPSESLRITGDVVGSNGVAWVADGDPLATVWVQTHGVYSTAIPNDQGQYFEISADAKGKFSISVPPGDWDVMAVLGNCNSAPPVRATGKASDRVHVTLEMRCNL